MTWRGALLTALVLSVSLSRIRPSAAAKASANITAVAEQQKMALVTKPSSHMVRTFDITLVTIATYDRMPLFKLLIERWQGPAVFLCVIEGASQKERPKWQKALHKAAGKGRLKMGRVYISPTAPDEFPINRFRNMAISKVATSHLFYVDVDFVPSATSYQDAKQLLLKNREYSQDRTYAFVVPAFMYAGSCQDVKACLKQFGDEIPGTFPQLMSQVQQRKSKVMAFGSKSAAQDSTDYDKWMSQGAEEVRPIECLSNLRYEPYVIVRKSDLLPSFDERFTGYGKNKIQWIVHLRYLGFKFMVLPQVFLTHFPHPPSDSKNSWDSGHRQRMDKLYLDFLEELHMLAVNRGTKLQIRLCEEASGTPEEDEDSPMIIHEDGR